MIDQSCAVSLCQRSGRQMSLVCLMLSSRETAKSGPKCSAAYYTQDALPATCRSLQSSRVQPDPGAPCDVFGRRNRAYRSEYGILEACFKGESQSTTCCPAAMSPASATERVCAAASRETMWTPTPSRMTVESIDAFPFATSASVPSMRQKDATVLEARIGKSRSGQKSM